jgi:hypothetical protein
VDLTPQLITLNQRSKSDKYHKNKHFKYIDTYKNSFVFVPKIRSPIPKSHFRYMISKCEIHLCLFKERVRIIRVKQQWLRKD